MFLEAYWNDGSPATQTRWLDNFVISTRAIGPVDAPRRPTLLLGGPHAQPQRADWQVEVGTPEGVIGWQSRPVTGSAQVTVSAASGDFVGPLAGQDELAADRVYYCHVRRVDPDGTVPAWSPWHQAFRTAGR